MKQIKNALSRKARTFQNAKQSQKSTGPIADRSKFWKRPPQHLKYLTLSAELERVLAKPGGLAGSSDGLGELPALAKTWKGEQKIPLIASSRLDGFTTAEVDNQSW